MAQLHDYDDFRGFDLPSGRDLEAISKRIYGRFRKSSWESLKHHLFNANIPNQLFNAIREIAMSDNKDDFKQERTFRRVAKIPI